MIHGRNFTQGGRLGACNSSPVGKLNPSCPGPLMRSDYEFDRGTSIVLIAVAILALLAGLILDGPELPRVIRPQPTTEARRP